MKIIFDKSKCIGCGSCVALCPKHWEMSEHGKANFKDSIINSATKNQELEVEKIGCAQEAADSCPVEAIFIQEI